MTTLKKYVVGLALIATTAGLTGCYVGPGYGPRHYDQGYGYSHGGYGGGYAGGGYYRGGRY